MNKTIAVAFAAGLMASGTGVVQAVIYKGHEYFLTNAATTWQAAEAEAIAAGGHLVAINDVAEELFIEATFVETATGKVPRWIGLNDLASEGNFVWTTGEPVTYLNWNPGEPNNMGGEDMVIFWPAAGVFHWNDVPLWYSGYHGIIERQFIDKEPPTLAVEVGPGVLWPPNRKMVNVVIEVKSSDNSGEAVTLSVEKVTSTDVDDQTTPDWLVLNIDQQLGLIYMQLRAERPGPGLWRVYTIWIAGKDSAGNTTTTSVEVEVPHDMGEHG